MGDSNNVNENFEKRLLDNCDNKTPKHQDMKKPTENKTNMTMFRENNDKFSSKRFVGIVGALILFGSLILSHFTEFKPEEYQINAVGLLAAAALGFTSIEKMKK